MFSLQNEGLVVKDVVVLIDREQGGEAHLAKNGLALHAAFKLSHLLSVLVKHGKVGDSYPAIQLEQHEVQLTRHVRYGAAWQPCKPKG
jgi:orotate phosphoribosyltransferase